MQAVIIIYFHSGAAYYFLALCMFVLALLANLVTELWYPVTNSNIPVVLIAVACNHLILSLRGLYHDKSVTSLNPTLPSMIVAPGPSVGSNTADTGVSSGQYYSQDIRISLVSAPHSPASPGKASRTKSSGDDGGSSHGDDARAMFDGDIGMDTFSGSDKHHGRDSEGMQEEGRVKDVEEEYRPGDAS